MCLVFFLRWFLSFSSLFLSVLCAIVLSLSIFYFVYDFNNNNSMWSLLGSYPNLPHLPPHILRMAFHQYVHWFQPSERLPAAVQRNRAEDLHAVHHLESQTPFCTPDKVLRHRGTCP